MKIAYVFEQFPRPSETFALREIEGLRRRGLEIVVLCARRGSLETAGSIQVVAPPRLFGRRWVCALAHLLVRHGARLPEFAGLLWRLAVRSPLRAAAVLLNLHALGEFSRVMGAEGIRHVHGYWLGWPARMASSLGALTGASMSLSGHARDLFTETASLDVLVRRASFLAVCTDQGRRHLEAVLAPDQTAKVRLVRHGILPQEMGSPVWGRNDDSAAPHVVAVGRLVRKKGLDVLLRAFQRVTDRCDRAHLTIIGEGPQEGFLRDLAGRLGLSDRVLLSGWLPHAKAQEAIRRACMLVVPSVVATDGDRDGTPNVILEAFACGTPVAASRLPGIEEAVEHEASGLLAPAGDPESLADAILRLIEDRALAEHLARGGRRVLETRFDALANSGRLEALFREAIDAPCRTAACPSRT